MSKSNLKTLWSDLVELPSEVDFIELLFSAYYKLRSIYRLFKCILWISCFKNTTKIRAGSLLYPLRRKSESASISYNHMYIHMYQQRHNVGAEQLWKRKTDLCHQMQNLCVCRSNYKTIKNMEWTSISQRWAKLKQQNQAWRQYGENLKQKKQQQEIRVLTLKLKRLSKSTSMRRVAEHSLVFHNH